jgi:hypothetical protein
MTKKPNSLKAQPPPKHQDKLMDALNQTGQRLNQTSKDFLRVDAQTALTFTEAALTTDNPEKKERNIKNAKKAYDTIQRLSEKVSYTDSERAYMSQMMARLKKDLELLGETL